jgi:hypothetical protein
LLKLSKKVVLYTLELKEMPAAYSKPQDFTPKYIKFCYSYGKNVISFSLLFFTPKIFCDAVYPQQLAFFANRNK